MLRNLKVPIFGNPESLQSSMGPPPLVIKIPLEMTLTSWVAPSPFTWQIWHCIRGKFLRVLDGSNEVRQDYVLLGIQRYTLSNYYHPKSCPTRIGDNKQLLADFVVLVARIQSSKPSYA